MRATRPPISAASSANRARRRLPVSRSSSALTALRCASVNSRAEDTSARANPSRSSTIVSKLRTISGMASMRRWSTRINRKLRTIAESSRIPEICPITARLRPTGKAGVPRAFRNSADAASAAAKDRSSATASAGRTAEAPAVTTSARAFAYRVATAESVMGLVSLGAGWRVSQIVHEAAHQAVLRLRRHAGLNLALRQIGRKLRGESPQFHAGGFSGGFDFPFGQRLDLGEFGCGMRFEPLGFCRGLRLGLAAQSRDVRFQVGQTQVDIGGARFGLFTQLPGARHVLDDLLRARREKGGRILGNQVA